MAWRGTFNPRQAVMQEIQLMKKELILVACAVLAGMVICFSVWFILNNSHRPLPNNTPASADRTTPQQIRHKDTELPSFTAQQARTAAQGIKSNLMSIYTEAQLDLPIVAQILNAMDSAEFVAYLEQGNITTQSWHDFLKSQGILIDKTAFDKVFRDEFSSLNPSDYEPEMRLKIAEMFLSTEPVNPTSPQEAALQRIRVIADLMANESRERAWFIGQFGEDWDSPFLILTEQRETQNAPAFEWMLEVQQNAKRIIATASETKGEPSGVPASAPAWDLSSVMERSDGETDIPTTADMPKHVSITEVEINERGEDQLQSAVTTNEHLYTLDQIQNTLENSVNQQWSKERVQRAMSALERYGPEEGIRRLRDEDPEIANQIERQKNREEINR